MKRNNLITCQNSQLGFLDKSKGLNLPEPGSYPRRTLRVARPTSSAFQFYGHNDSCLHDQCGLDVYLVEYIALKLEKTLT